MPSFKMLGLSPSGPAPEPWGKEEIAACIWFWLKYIGGVVALGEGGSIRSDGAWGFLLKGNKGFFAGVNKRAITWQYL